MKQNRVPTTERQASRVMFDVFETMPRTANLFADSSDDPGSRAYNRLLAAYVSKAQPSANAMGAKMFAPTPLLMFIAAGVWQKARQSRH